MFLILSDNYIIIWQILKQFHHNTIDSNIKKCNLAVALSYHMNLQKKQKKMLFAEKHYNDRYFLLYVAKRGENGPQTLKRDHRNRMRQFIYSKLDIPKDIIKSDHQRGKHLLTSLYDNSREFLRGPEIDESKLVKSIDTSTEGPLIRT